MAHQTGPTRFSTSVRSWVKVAGVNFGAKGTW